jgi:hypothetical protein
VLASSTWLAHSADLKIPQMKTVSLRNNSLKAAFAGLLFSATLINAGEVKAVPCLLSTIASNACADFNDGVYKVNNFTITPLSPWNGPGLDQDVLRVGNLGGILTIDVTFGPGRGFPAGAMLMYDVMKLVGDPLQQASSNATVGGVPPIGGGTTSVSSTIVGLTPGSLNSVNGGIVSGLFTPLVTSTKVSTVFSSTAPGTITSFKVEFTPGAPVPPPSLVPGPLPLLGAGAAFGFSRRLRRRINTSATA